MLTHSLVNKSKIEMKEIIDIGRFSSERKLVRTMAYVFRFVTNLRSQKKHVDRLTVNELERAERYIIKRVQSDYFPEEIAYLHETNKKQTKVPQYVSQFGLCLDENQILRCKVSKNYILLLTCCSTRAVHLEVCNNLTVQSFYMSFRRFAARRGLPRLLVSDNALTFKTASKEVSKIVRSTEVKDFLVNKGVDWKFITERASWMGGTWERLVQTVKRSIKKVIGHSSLNFEELDTLVTEVEAVVNERRLTYVYDDLEGVAYPLTPAQLIYGRNLATFNDKHFEICSTNEMLTRHAKYHKQLLRQFTSRWKTEYLQGLQEIKRNERQNQPDFNVGDFVILKDFNTPRQFWKLAKIEEFIESSDGVVRSVVICVAGKDGERKLLRRAVQHLVPLEIISGQEREVHIYKENDNDNNLDESKLWKRKKTKEKRSYYW